MRGYGVGGGLGGVDDVHGVVEGGEGTLDHFFEKRVVGAAQEEGVGFRGFGQSFGEIDAKDFGCDGMVDPAFFYQGDEEGAGFFSCGQAQRPEGLEVGVRLDRGCGGEDQDVCGLAWLGW